MEKTVEENNISSKRLTYCLGMGLLFLTGQVLLCLGQEILLDQLFMPCNFRHQFLSDLCACPDEAPLIRRTSPEAVRFLSKGIFIGLAGMGSPACRILLSAFFYTGLADRHTFVSGNG